MDRIDDLEDFAIRSGADADCPRVRSILSRRASAVDLVRHEIRRSILSGELPPGQPFTVPALTEQLGVSHVPVREALRQLEAQGLIALNRSRSATVTPLDADDLRSIYRPRIMLEPELAALSAPQRTDEAIDDLDRMMRATFGDLVGEGFWATHDAFHTALIAPAASKWDRRLLTRLWDASERYTRLALDPAERPESRASRRAYYYTLMDAVRSRAADRVRTAVRKQLKSSEAVVLAAVGGRV